MIKERGSECGLKKKIVRRGLEYYVEMEALVGEEYEYQMCMRQSIASFLPMGREQMDQKDMLMYNITECIPFVDVWENVWIKEQQLIRIVENVIMAVKQAERYLLYPDNLVLNKDDIYVEKGEGKVALRFLYVPGYQQDILEQIRHFLEDMLEQIDKNDVKAVLLAWKIHSILKESRINWKELESCVSVTEEIPLAETQTEGNSREGSEDRRNEEWEERKREFDIRSEESKRREALKRREASKRREEAKGRETGRKKQGSKNRRDKKEKQRGEKSWILLLQGILEFVLLGIEGYLLYLIYYGGILVWKRNALLGNTAFLLFNGAVFCSLHKKQKQEQQLKELFEEGGEQELTTLLEVREDRKEARLCSVKGERADIPIRCNPFILGKSPQEADYCLKQSVISRCHAKITKKEDRYYIEDMASTNGTYLNEKRLKSGILYEIHERDCIRLADIEFIFTIC